MSIGVRRMPIESLSPDIKNALVIGVIIGKQPVKTFISPKGTLLFLWDIQNYHLACTSCSLLDLDRVKWTFSAELTFTPLFFIIRSIPFNAWTRICHASKTQLRTALFFDELYKLIGRYLPIATCISGFYVNHSTYHLPMLIITPIPDT